MKKVIHLTIVLLFCITATAQEFGCGHDRIVQLQRENNKNYDDELKRLNEAVKNYIDANYNKPQPPPTNTLYTIPVVFHIVHPSGDAYGTGANISYNQILSQLNAINAAYQRNYPAYNGQQHAAYAQNTNIRFCLARTAMPANVSFYNGPSGTEWGVMRYADNNLTNHQMTIAGANALLGLTHPSPSYFPFANYLNIWVVTSMGNGPGTVMGYAPTPLMNGYPLDGVVMRSDVVGDNSTGSTFNLGYNLQQGKVLCHEIGHYLNLYHIFQGGCAGANPAGSLTDACDLNGDFICDIEPCTTQNYNCLLGTPNTCTANYNTGTTTLDMLEDYMSYADDDCMNTFTADQCQRMWTTLNQMRFNLWQNANLSATGVIGNGGCLSAFLMKQISKSTNNICAGVSFTLSNPLGGNSATSWSWTTAGAIPASGNSNSLVVNYPSPGSYWAILAVSDGTTTLYDSLAIPVSNCSLDSSKLDRSHWYFGNYAEINFATTPASAGNSAWTYSTMYQGFESTVSMSDRNGNLLFYTNSTNLWDRNHNQVNNSPLFANQGGSSTPGLISIPFPGDSSRYVIISSPHTGQDYDSIYYAVYDTLQQIVTPKRGFRHASLPAKYAEGLTVVPHCNGSDYWIICRPWYTQPTAANGYAMLLTSAGPQNIDTVIVSQGMVPATSGQLKANPAGNRLIQANYGGGPFAYFYNFNQATGQITNQTPSLPTTNGSAIPTGAVFSPNGTVAYVVVQYAFGQVSQLHKIDMTTMTTQSLVTPNGFKGLQLEVGPDNNIYVSQTDYMNLSVGRIINPNNWATAQFIPSVINFNGGINPFGGLCNFMDARPGPVLDADFVLTMLNCTTFQMTVGNCWSVYKASWQFGDGATGQGLNVSHTYAGPGTYPVQLILSVGNYSLPPVIKYVTILPQTVAITGPTVLCQGNPYPNSYGTASVSGATYTWTVNNGGVMGPNGLPFADIGSSGTGVMTIAVTVNNNGCISNGTKTVVIDALPVITFTLPPQVCQGNTIALTANPAGGGFSGAGVNGSTFSASATGTAMISYSVATVNGCAGLAQRTINVVSAPQVSFASLPHQVCVNAPLSLTASPQGGTFLGAGVTGSTFVPQSAGVYTINYNYAQGNCSSTTSRTVSAVVCTGLENEIIRTGGLRVFPNPSGGRFTIIGTGLTGRLEVINAIGQVIETRAFTGDSLLDLSMYPNGLYVVQLSSEQGVQTIKLIKQAQ